MRSENLAILDATAQTELVRRKEVSPLELVDAAIERIERLNPAVNAVVIKTYDRARDAARGPLPDGPFRGVPFLLKDLVVEEAGVPLHEASAYLSDYVPAEDAELVKRLKRAGLVILGRTNSPELGLGPTTESRLWGPTRNPWDVTRSPGGSSGGAAAAVATRMVPMAHGNDAGGSIRVPAACCGVFGLKPTRARNPLGPHYGDVMSGLVAEHALTRSVRDSARLLDATAGPDLGDPYWAPSPPRPFADEVATPPGRLRIAWATRPLVGQAVHRDCVAAVEDAARLCASLGHEVVEAAPRVDGERFWTRLPRCSPSASRGRSTTGRGAPGASRRPSCSSRSRGRSRGGGASSPVPTTCLHCRTCSGPVARSPASSSITTSGSRRRSASRLCRSGPWPTRARTRSSCVAG